MRGWLHLGAAPLALVAGMALVVFAPTLEGRISAAIFTLSAVLLFGTSAVYHRGNWSPQTKAVRGAWTTEHLHHHCGTYTPLTVLLLEGTQRVVVLCLVWGGALLGVIFRVLWVGAPRWLYVPMYVALAGLRWGTSSRSTRRAASPWCSSWPLAACATPLAPSFTAPSGPRGSERYFGLHEIFHALTIAGFVCHFIAVCPVISADT